MFKKYKNITQLFNTDQEIAFADWDLSELDSQGWHIVGMQLTTQSPYIRHILMYCEIEATSPHQSPALPQTVIDAFKAFANADYPSAERDELKEDLIEILDDIIFTETEDAP